MIRLALFDCDGTLVDSGAVICRAMAEAFAAHGRTAPSPSAIRQIVGLSLVEAVAALIPDEDVQLHRHIAAAYKTTFQAMRARGLVEEPLFDGIPEAIETLTDAGWTLGIATGKSDRGLAHVLAAHALTARFATLQTADRHPSKPHPAMAQAAMTEVGAMPANTIVIGDTSYDMAMAVNAGARAIGVAWGYHPVGALAEAGATSVVHHPHELATVMETL